MTPYRVVPLDFDLADRARKSLASPQYGHPAHAEMAAGYGPCRQCLRQFRVGEERRLLFTYNPFADLDSYPCPGPIFVHEEPCSPFEGDGVFPEELRHLPLTFEGYGPARWLVARERPTAGNLEEAIERLFANPGIEYIHVRNTEAGCFIARIEKLRSASRPDGIERHSR